MSKKPYGCPAYDPDPHRGCRRTLLPWLKIQQCEYCPNGPEAMERRKRRQAFVGMAFYILFACIVVMWCLVMWHLYATRQEGAHANPDSQQGHLVGQISAQHRDVAL